MGGLTAWHYKNNETGFLGSYNRPPQYHTNISLIKLDWESATTGLVSTGSVGAPSLNNSSSSTTATFEFVSKVSDNELQKRGRSLNFERNMPSDQLALHVAWGHSNITV
nr:PREDICTED: V-type proton ATPase subunit F isoform X2 [Lepisosteus oculatus]